MGKESAIQWTTHTWNPWQGCKKKSAGCKFCYMYRDKTKYGQDPTVVVRSKPATFNKPLTWKDPAYVFLASWSDFWNEEADEWREEAFRIIKATPHLTYQILTKLPERIPSHLPKDWGAGYPNVWIGTSVEDQDAWDKRHPHMNEFAAVQKFFSFEPLIGPIHLWGWYPDKAWAIIGGESGNERGDFLYRPCERAWIDWLIQQCRAMGLSIFVKQMGTYLSHHMHLLDRHGGDWDEWPPEYRIREFPKPL